MPRNPSKLFPHDYVLRACVLPFIPDFVQPNHLTLLRMSLTPVVVYLLATDNLALGVPLFLLTAFTDALDGSLARTRKQITPWGILFDPVADKLLIGLVVLVFAIRYYHPWLVLAAVVIDLIPLVIWLGRVKRAHGIMMANLWGKSKLVLQCGSVTLLMFGVLLHLPPLVPAGELTLLVATVLAVIATVTYSL